MTFSTEMPRRITLVITELRPGGAEKCLTQLAEGLTSLGWEVQVVSLKPPPPEDRRQLVDRLETSDVEVHYLNLKSIWQLRTAVAKFRGLLRSFQPSIVQSFLYHANVLAGREAAKAGLPHFAGLRVAPTSRFRATIQRWACQKTRRLICVSEDVRQAAISRLRLPETRLVVIPNGIDVESWNNAIAADNRQIGLPAGAAIILFAGRLHPQKSVDTLIKASSHFLAQLPNHHLVVAGEGPQLVPLEMLAGRTAFSERIHLLGWRPDLPALIAAADLFVLPSAFEGMANVLLEAMAAQLPIVASDVEGSRELLGDHAEIQLVEPGNIQQLAERIVELIANADLRQNLGDANHRRVTASFSIETMVAGYLDAYSKLE